MTFVDLEDLTVDNNANEIVDNVRTGADDRSTVFTTAEVWPDGSLFSLEQTDFDTYYSTSEENILYGGSKHEGIIVYMTGNPIGAPRGMAYARMYLGYDRL